MDVFTVFRFCQNSKCFSRFFEKQRILIYESISLLYKTNISFGGKKLMSNLHDEEKLKVCKKKKARN